MSNYLDELNAAQREAAEYGVASGGAPGGPLLIIAGAGTGKTNTLAFRVAHLIQNGADPRRILLLTFTRRASEEMIKRSQRILAKTKAAAEKQGRATDALENTYISWAGTFHSVGNRLLRLYADAIKLEPSFTVMDRSDAEDLMNKVRNDLGYAKKHKRFPKKNTCYAIYSHAVNSQAPVEKSLETDFPWCRDWAEDLKDIFRHYVLAKQKLCVLDYDDLLLYWFHMMRVPDVAASVGKRFDHVLVDEYQDTNVLQAQIIYKLKPDGKGVAVVGDDAQSIYAFRAATVRNILDFPAQFTPKAKIITLEKNYRSTQPVLDCCNALIGQAAERFTKNLFSEKPSQEKPHYISATDESAQVKYVVKKVLEYREAGIDLTKQAVLFRASHHSAELEVELGRHNIPFLKYGGLKFLEAGHVKDALCILRCAENPRDAVAMFRVLQLLEGFGPAAATRAIDYLESLEWDFTAWRAFKAPSSSAEEWPRLLTLLSTLRQKNTQWQGQMRLVKTWFLPHLRRIYDNADAREKDIEQLELMASGFRDRASFLSDLTLDPPDGTSDKAGDPVLDEDYLILSTIHSAKGGEWNSVFILNVADGWIPSDMATTTPEQIEEERRLLYVAMTRAKEHLHLIQPLRFYTHNHKHGRADAHIYSMPSRFMTTSVLNRAEKLYFGKDGSSTCTPEEASFAQVDVASKVMAMWA